MSPQGSIYHLDLFPGELAETIILVGDPIHAKLVLRYFDCIEIKKSKREFIIHTEKISNHRLSIIRIDIGSEGNIDIIINEANALFNVDFKELKIKSKLTRLRFIRFRTAVALQPEISVDSYVVSERAIGFDGLINF
ncbi:hypothetical protein [Candidatus Coxiella mudrowiae]|uniref:hypothetical protein n=1 Tax=Candidatus Coxiella mudrowiae TaxID=2054173 RepID=UPI0006626A59|nr:hypothetical protein [Candidatus Coxiella mudrowiae]